MTDARNPRAATAGAATRPRRRRNPAFRIGGGISLRLYIATAAAAFALFLVAWVIVRSLGLADEKFLPWPWDVVSRLASLAIDGTLWADVSVSVQRIMAGFLLATVMAVPIGVLIGTYRIAEAFIEPFVDFVRYMPVTGFVPLTIVWIGIDESQKWSIVWIGTFFQMVLLVMDNVKRVPLELVNIGRTLGMRDRGILARIVVPSAAPEIWDTLRISLGWAWTWVVLAELVAASTGLGYRINVAKKYFQTDTIIGYLIVLGILGLFTDQAMKAIGRVLFRWSER